MSIKPLSFETLREPTAKDDTIAASYDVRLREIEALQENDELYLGLDVGSISSDIVVMDSFGGILYCDYRRTMGSPIECAKGQLEEIFTVVKPSSIKLSAITGSAGRLIARILDTNYVNEVPAQAKGVGAVCPDIDKASVIDMGGQDSKLLILAKEKGKIILRAISLTTGCAAGTGRFIDQQALS